MARSTWEKAPLVNPFFSLLSNLSSLTNFGDFVALTLGPGTNTIQLNKTGITDVNTTSFTYPSTTRSTSYRWTTYDINLQATLSAKTPPYTYLYCSVSQGLRVIMTTGGSSFLSFLRWCLRPVNPLIPRRLVTRQRSLSSILSP